MPRRQLPDLATVQREWQLLEAVPHAALVPFIRKWGREQRSWITVALALCIAAAVAALLFSIATSPTTPLLAGIQIISAPLLLMVILPLHEGLHHAAYRLAGARQVRWTVAWRRGIAYVAAHHFVVTPRALTLVALAPFLVITMALIATAGSWPDVAVLATAVLVLHTAACVGDLAMLNFLWHHRDREVVTFDDAEENVTYFYTR